MTSKLNEEEEGREREETIKKNFDSMMGLPDIHPFLREARQRAKNKLRLDDLAEIGEFIAESSLTERACIVEMLINEEEKENRNVLGNS